VVVPSVDGVKIILFACDDFVARILKFHGFLKEQCFGFFDVFQFRSKLLHNVQFFVCTGETHAFGESEQCVGSPKPCLISGVADSKNGNQTLKVPPWKGVNWAKNWNDAQARFDGFAP